MSIEESAGNRTATRRFLNPALSGQWSRLTRRRALGLAAAAGASGAFAACATKNGSTANKGSQAAVAGKPKPGGTLNVGIPADYFNFDSSLGGKSTPNDHAIGLVYDTLLADKQGTGVGYDESTLIPRLADRWETPDAQTYTFHLHPGVHFANLPPVQGRALTSADVQWSLEYLGRIGQFKAQKLPKNTNGFMFAGMDTVQTPDANTVVVHFQQPFAPFLSFATSAGMPIMAHEIFDADGSFSKQLVGSGPFQLDTASTQHGAQWVFQKNQQYWDSGKPYVDTVHCLVLSDLATSLAAFTAKQLDIAPGTGLVLNTTLEPEVQKNNPTAQIQGYFTAGGYSLYLSYTHPPFNDVRMRQAFSFAIDRDAFVRNLSQGKGEWDIAEGALSADFTQDEIKQILKYDPQKAKSLMSAAGNANGATIEFMLRAGNIPQPIVELLQSQVKQVGFTMNIKTVDKATGSDRLHKGDFDVTAGGLALQDDQDSRLAAFYSNSPSNYVGVRDPQLDKLLDAERKEADPAKRHDAIKAALKYMAEQAVSVAIYRDYQYTVWQSYLNNYSNNWHDHAWNAANVWLNK